MKERLESPNGTFCTYWTNLAYGIRGRSSPVVGIAVAIMMGLLLFWPVVMRWIEEHIEWLD